MPRNQVSLEVKCQRPYIYSHPCPQSRSQTNYTRIKKKLNSNGRKYNQPPNKPLISPTYKQ